MTDYPYTYLMAVGGKPKEYLDQYRETHIARNAAAFKYAESIGAICAVDLGSTIGMRFERGKVPAGWKKPSRRGYSLPYANNSDADAAISAIPEMPTRGDIETALSLPSDVYTYKDGERVGTYGMCGSFGSWNMYQPCWWSGETPVVLAKCPNLKYERILHAARDLTVRFNIPEFPDGFESVTGEQVDFWFAEQKLKNAS